MFDWENAIALHAMQGNRASSRGEGEVSWVFSSYGRPLVYILELRRGWPFETWVSSSKSGLLSSMTDTSGSFTMHGRKIQTLLEVSWEAKHPLLVGRVILVFLSIFTKSQASSPFEALNSAQLSKSQMDVRTSLQKRLNCGFL